MNTVLMASRREIEEAYKLALWREDYQLAEFWRLELIDRTVALVNQITKE